MLRLAAQEAAAQEAGNGIGQQCPIIANMARTISKALLSGFPLPGFVGVGDQKWRLRCLTRRRKGDTVNIEILLTGPHGNSRRVEICFETEALLSERYDSAAAVDAIAAWLPHSDESERLRLSPEPRLDSLIDLTTFAGNESRNVLG